MGSDFRVLIDSDQIRNRVTELAQAVSRDYEFLDLHVVGVLRGAYQFTRDLSQALEIPHSVDYISVASYGESTRSSGRVQLRMELKYSVAGKDILIVDDIIDTGTTLRWLVDHIETLGPRSVKTCCLLDKPSRRMVDLAVHYVGFTIEDLFVVGYGLDYQEKYRELPFISWVSPREVLV